MENNLPKKYEWLNQAKEAGIKTPETLYFSEKDITLNNFQSPAVRFIESFPEESFIVRSAVEGEDGEGHSYAGHFTSSGKVKGKEVLGTIRAIFEANKLKQEELCPTGTTNLMLQVYVPMQLGGVCFTPWQYFYHHALVEYSSQGASSVVEGNKEGEAILDLRSQIYKESWQKDLSGMVQKLCKKFNVPLDIEWGQSLEGDVYIFQVRPITFPIGGIEAATESQSESQKQLFQDIKKGAWSRSGFSESLGLLSPLSFSLWKNLYASVQPFLQNIGCETSDDIFFARAKNGQIYSHSESEQSYFQAKGAAGAFKMAFKKSFLHKEIITDLKKVSGEFSFENIEKIFSWWLVANLYVSQKNISFWGDVGEYELSWKQSVFPPELKKTDWESLRLHLKQLFVYHLSELKKTLSPEDMFGVFNVDWKIESGEYKGLEESLVIYPASFQQEKAMNYVVVVSGKENLPCEVIFQPENFKGPLPEGKVIIAPYFDNRWVSQIPKLKGVVLEQGGSLSHSAIVAREYRIPYIINVDNAVKIYKKEQNIDLSQF